MRARVCACVGARIGVVYVYVYTSDLRRVRTDRGHPGQFNKIYSAPRLPPTHSPSLARPSPRARCLSFAVLCSALLCSRTVFASNLKNEKGDKRSIHALLRFPNNVTFPNCRCFILTRVDFFLPFYHASLFQLTPFASPLIAPCSPLFYF